MIWFVVPALILTPQEATPVATPISIATKAGITVELWSVDRASQNRALIKTTNGGKDKWRYSTIILLLKGETATGEWIDLKQIELDATKKGGEWSETFAQEAFSQWTGGTRIEIVGLELSHEQLRQNEIAKEPKAARQALLDRKVRVGMTRKQALLCWGKPAAINTTITKRGREEQWVYDIGDYLYLSGDKVTGIQFHLDNPTPLER